MKSKSRIRKIIYTDGDIEYMPEVLVKWWFFSYWKSIGPTAMGSTMPAKSIKKAKLTIKKYHENCKTKKIIYIEED